MAERERAAPPPPRGPLDFAPGGPVGHAPLPSRVLAGRSREAPAVPSGRHCRTLAAPGASAAAEGKGEPRTRKCSWSKGTTRVGESAKSHLAWKSESVMLVPDLLYEHRVEERERKGEREGKRWNEKKEKKKRKLRQKKRERKKENRREKRERRKEGKRNKVVVGRGKENKKTASPGSIGPADGTSRGCGWSWLLGTSGPTLGLQT